MELLRLIQNVETNLRSWANGLGAEVAEGASLVDILRILSEYEADFDIGSLGEKVTQLVQLRNRIAHGQEVEQAEVESALEAMSSVLGALERLLAVWRMRNETQAAENETLEAEPGEGFDGEEEIDG